MLGNKGFTLIELISTLVIISVLAATFVPRYIEIDKTSRLRAIDVGVAELNGRETLTWALVKISNTGYESDVELWTVLTSDNGTQIGADYDWPSGPPSRTTGGTLRFKNDTSAAIGRVASSRETPGKWGR